MVKKLQQLQGTNKRDYNTEDQNENVPSYNLWQFWAPDNIVSRFDNVSTYNMLKKQTGTVLKCSCHHDTENL